MHQEIKNFMWLALLRSLLYRRGLEVDVQYLWGMLLIKEINQGFLGSHHARAPCLSVLMISWKSWHWQPHVVAMRIVNHGHSLSSSPSHSLARLLPGMATSLTPSRLHGYDLLLLLWYRPHVTPGLPFATAEIPLVQLTITTTVIIAPFYGVLLIHQVQC